MKKLNWIILGAALLSGTGLHAQQQAGKQNIDKLCGCFDVDFKYAETFSPVKDYKFHDREHMGATELALPIETTGKKVVIQHLLVMGDSMVIKHWREEWVYEPAFMLRYDGDKKWVKEALKPDAVKGKWMQTVWEVDDAPRYQGFASWYGGDPGSNAFWQNITDAPLPRREYTVRNDYNILQRGNRITITDSGYVHEQDNQKVAKTGGKRTLVAEEKGYNTYVKTDPAKCAAGKEWWEKNGAFWNTVRANWDALAAAQPVILLVQKVDGKSLNDQLTALWKQWRDKKLSITEVSNQSKDILQKFALAINDMAAN